MAKKKIFFGLFHTLGDILVSTSLIRTIKDKYPDSTIDYAVSREYADILRNNPDIDEVIECGHSQEVLLRSENKPYDKVYLPLMMTQEHTLWHQTYPWCEDTGEEGHNLVDMYAEKCQDDLKVTTRRTYIYPEEKHWEEILNVIPDKHKDVFTKVPYITIHTTSRNPSKDWSYEKFAQLCIKIKEKYSDINIIQVGGKEDKNLPAPVIAIKETPILNTAAIIKRSKLHIDIDSGPSFIADSLDIPTICIMGATNRNMAGPLNWDNTTYIEPTRECLGTATHCACATKCLINKPCIDTLSVENVFDVVDNKLKEVLRAGTA